MPAVVLQRYLLVASQPSFSVPASGTTLFQATTAAVPLGATWTIRFRSVSVQVACDDASGALQLETFQGQWQLLDIRGNVLFTMPVVRGDVTPPIAFPKGAGVTISRWADPDQTISSFDQVGNAVAVSVNCFGSSVCLNTDAANPHPGHVNTFAVLEFEQPGSNE